MRLLALLAGCGFHGLANIDVDAGGDLAGAADLATAADLAGADLAGADLATAGDLAQAANNSGPGPLGALPTGFCCTSDEQCRSRSCIGNPGYCSDQCASDAVCTAWVPGFACNTSANTCQITTGTCRPADQYQHGTKATGACCSHGFPTAGAECLGGLCQSTGNDANPFYCTQGCDQVSPCPGGYSCVLAFCWITQTVNDTTYMYMCQ
jgi:hypothetical protein